MSHPKGYYTATKSVLVNGKQGKWYRFVKKKSDDAKSSFNLAVQALDTSAGPTTFTTNFTDRDNDTEV